MPTFPTVPWLSNPGVPVTAPSAAPVGGFQYQDPMNGMGFLDRIAYLRDNNPEVLGSLAAGLLKGDLGSGIAGATKAMGELRKEEQDKQVFATQQNQTKQYLIDNGYTEAEANAAINNPTILNAFLQRKTNELNQKAQFDYQTANGGAAIYGNPINVIGPNGEFGVAFGAKDGSGLVMDGAPVPKGWRAMSPYETSLGRGAGAGGGKDYSEVRAKARTIKAQLPHIRAVTEDLKSLAKSATNTLAGRVWNEGVLQTTGQSTKGAIDRTNFETKVKNVILPTLRTTFGAQFTEAEGRSLVALLGDPDIGPDQKIAAIENYVDQQVANLDAAESEAEQFEQGAPSGVIPGVGGGGNRIRYDNAGNRIP